MGLGNGCFNQMMNEYLHKEYELCFEQLRFYDERQINLQKFLFTLTSAVAAGQFAIYKLFGTATKDFYLSLAFLAIVVFVASLLIYLSMLQNRLYFVFMARQINALRGHLLSAEAPTFRDNQLYLKTDFAAVKPFSVHTFMLIGSAVLTSLFAATFSYALSNYMSGTSSWCLVSIVFVAFTILLSYGGYVYLRQQSLKSADTAIHHEM
jgi:hypothetical protein